MKYDQLINKQFHILQRNKINKDKDKSEIKESSKKKQETKNISNRSDSEIIK